MVIDRSKHNKYVAKPTYQQTTQQQEEQTSQGSTTVIVTGGISGGSGLTPEQLAKLNSIEEGAQKNQNAFSHFTTSSGDTSFTQDARIPTDTANITINGEGGVQVKLTDERGIQPTVVQSAGTNKGVWQISYQKVETVITPEQPPVEDTENPDEEQPVEPVEPVIEVTYPLIFTYVSGDILTIDDFEQIVLYNNDIAVKTYTKSQLTIEGTSNNITSITIEEEGLYFDHVYFTIAQTDPEPVTINICDFTISVQLQSVYTIGGGDQYWHFDEKNNAIWTEYNVYSKKEISAYGFGSGTSGGGGAGYLDELNDVVITNVRNGDILQYNGTNWVNVDGDSIGNLKAENLKAGTNIKIEVNGEVITITNTYVLPVATDTVLGGIKVSKANDALLGYPVFKVGTDGLLDIADVLKQRLVFLKDLNDMFEWDKTASATDTTKWRIKAKRDLWSVGEVSAYGYGSSGQPTGAQYLNELRDVTVQNASSGQILIYNGTQWVNQDIPETGLNETQLSEYLESHYYIQQSDLTPYATKEWTTDEINIVKTQITNLIGDAPQELDTLGEIADQIQILTPLLDWFSFVDGRIRANYNFWGVGEISAYGYGDSSLGSTQYLRDLLDVNNGNGTNPTSRDTLLMWNGSTWAYVDKNSIGLNTDELQDYLDSNNYTKNGISSVRVTGEGNVVTTASVSNHILTLTKGIDAVFAMSVTGSGNAITHAILNGGTLSLVKQESFALANGTNATGSWGINITGNAGTASKLAIPRTITLTGSVTGSVTFDGSNNVSIATAYTTNNISALDNRYVNISGDTMTGNLTLPAAIVQSYVRIGDIYLRYDSTNRALYIQHSNSSYKANFYAQGEVSAYGSGSGSSGSGASYLSELQDVLLTSLTSNQLLMYNGSKWVNIDKDEVGLNQSQLAQYLTTNNYAKKSDIPDSYTKTQSDQRYVTLATNQTITGSKIFSEIVRADKGVRVQFDTDSSRYIDLITSLDTSEEITASIGFHNVSNNIFVCSSNVTNPWTDKVGNYSLKIGIDTLTYNTYPIITSNNYTSYITRLGTSTIGASNRPIYLNGGNPTALSATIGSGINPIYLSGGTITASTSTIGHTSRPIYISNGQLTVCAYTFGNGSGNAAINNGIQNTDLNADLLDGYHHDSFMKFVDNVSGSTSDTLFNKIGIRTFVEGYPSSLPSEYRNYNYGGSTTFVGNSMVFELYYDHHSSNTSRDYSGISYRTAWIGSSTNGWKRFLDDYNYNHYITELDNLTHAIASNYIQIGNGRIYWDSTNNALYVKSSDGSSAINFYSTGEVTAYGAGSGSGVSVVTIVDNLTSTSTDAALSANQGRVLKQLIDNKTVDLSGYYTKTESDSRFMRNARITSTDANTINYTYPAVREINSGSNMPTSDNWHQILSWGSTDSGYGAQFAHRYNSSNTTQNLYFRHKTNGSWGSWKEIAFTDTVTDAIDEVEASITNMIAKKLYTLNTSSLSTSNFYPIMFFPGYSDLWVEISTPNGQATTTYNNNRINFVAHSNGWGDSGESLTILNQYNYDTGEITIGAIGFGTWQGGIAVWVRGGIGNITVKSNFEPSLKTSNYTYGDQVYSVGSNLTGGTNTHVSIVWENTSSSRTNNVVAYVNSNVASADKLYTARNINGTPFDGQTSITTTTWGATRTISLTGAVTGSVTTNGGSNITINTTYAASNISALDNRYVNVTGDTMSGGLNIRTSSITSTQLGAGTIELYHSNPYIDFHYNGSTSDYNVRLINEASGVLSIYADRFSAAEQLWAMGGAFRITNSNVMSTSGVTTQVNVSSSNPFFALKQGSYTWYIQAASNVMYLGPSTTMAPYIDSSGNIRIQNGKNLMVNNGSQWSTYGGGSIELYGGTPYIDFHQNNSTSDYTFRIIAEDAVSLNFNDVATFSRSGNNILYNKGYILKMTTIDASNLSENTYYPVTMYLDKSQNIRIEIHVALDSGTTPSWSTHANGFTAHVIWESNGYGWGTSTVTRDIKVATFGHCDVNPVRGISQMTNSSTEYVYVRGGGKYYFYTSSNITPVLRTSTFTFQSQSISPTTTTPAEIIPTAVYRRYTIGSLGINWLGYGNGDGASYTTHNVTMRLHYGLGIHDNYDNCTIVINSRSGSIQLQGNVVAEGEVTAYSTSDIRLKHNLTSLQALSKIRNMQIYEYDWNDEAMQLRADTNKHDYGLIAQELETIVPEAITHNMFSKGYLGINYNRLVPFALSAIKEVDNEVTKLKKRVKRLEVRLSRYEHVD